MSVLVRAFQDWAMVPLAFMGTGAAGAGLGFLLASAAPRMRRRHRKGELRRLREAIDAMPEGLAFYDADDRIMIWNARYAELNDQGGGSLVPGARFMDLLQGGLDVGVYPEAVGREAEWLESRMALHNAEQSTHEQLLADGRCFRIEERRTTDGGVVAVIEDITELKAREASLRLMFADNPVPMWLIDVETMRFVDVNQAALAHYGYSRERFLEMTLIDIVAPSDREIFTEQLTTWDHSEYRGDRAWKHLKADGTEIDVRPYVQVISREGRATMLAAQFDVTLRMRAEEAMAQARDEAEAASRAKSEFLANMSHEIRTPLNGVAGVAQVLSRTPLSTQQQEMVRIIESSAGTLERLLTDVLDLARVEAGHIDIREEPFDLAETIRATAGLTELRAAEKGIGFELEIEPAAEVMVSGDAGRLKQILFNLLSNALKFTAEGQVTLRVSTVPTPSSTVFRFEVEDTGVGFDPACKDRLFQRFEQADGSITRRFGGTGLGLAISRDLADLMGGRLDARSVPGQGSVFTLELPLQRQGERPAEADTGPGMQSGGARLRVLLAEDHMINRQVVQLMLADADVDLTCVSDGSEAVQAAVADRFDVILMDMQMPVMDGLTALAAIRGHEAATGAPRTPIFVLSANAMAEHARASMAAGADRHLTKPISAPSLLGALSEVAQQKAEALAA